MTIAMIPARMGSQRLKRKNLRMLNGVSLLAHAVRRTQQAGIFNEIWVNSEDDAFREIADEEGVDFHKRPAELASDSATSEDFVYEFLQRHPCDRLVQVHSIAPLIAPERIREFVEVFQREPYDVLLSCTLEQIECAYEGTPINFSFDAKTNSQELKPIQRITWGLTGWKRDAFTAAYTQGKTATYAGAVGFFPLSRIEGQLIKTEEDMQIAAALQRITGSER
ncbi:MAG: NTP transferase domain-containing protein [Candidatus Hydrogenedentes bacterium]|nr:NTP transferase domain-containing protein [Candidatus Hydrogenedentota bacterium]